MGSGSGMMERALSKDGWAPARSSGTGSGMCPGGAGLASSHIPSSPPILRSFARYCRPPGGGLFRWPGAGFLRRVERCPGSRRADRAELLLIEREVLADGPDDVEHRGRRYPHPGDQAVRRADHHLAGLGPCFGRRLAAHEEVEGELVRRVPDRQAIGVRPGLQRRVGVRLELDSWLSRWLAHTPNATRTEWTAAAGPGG